MTAGQWPSRKLEDTSHSENYYQVQQFISSASFVFPLTPPPWNARLHPPPPCKVHAKSLCLKLGFRSCLWLNLALFQSRFELVLVSLHRSTDMPWPCSSSPTSAISASHLSVPCAQPVSIIWTSIPRIWHLPSTLVFVTQSFQLIPAMRRRHFM